MVAAIFYQNSWMGHKEYFFEGTDARDILMQVNNVQDLACLSRQAGNMGTSKDKKEIKKLDELLEKFYNQEIDMDDLLDFSLDISLGDMGFSAIAKTDEEIERLRK